MVLKKKKILRKNKKYKILFFILSNFKFFVFFFLILVILLFLLFYNLLLFIDYRSAVAKQADINEKQYQVEEKNINIKKQLDFLNTKTGTQKAVLEHYLIKRPGERVVEIIDF